MEQQTGSIIQLVIDKQVSMSTFAAVLLLQSYCQKPTFDIHPTVLALFQSFQKAKLGHQTWQVICQSPCVWTGMVSR